MPQPAVARLPRSRRAFLADAVRDGGGKLVELEQAEAIVWTDPTSGSDLRRLLDRHPGIRWVQLPFAGIEPFVDLLDTDRVWTAGQGVYAEEVAEHALALALAGMRHLVGYARTIRWSAAAGRNLLGARVSILGGGGIARSLARLLTPFEPHLTVVRRRDEPFDGADLTTTTDRLDEVLATTDVLFLALALTPETAGILDGRRLGLLPGHAWVVNVARGGHIVTDDLVEAVTHGSIAGAALDVTDPEPLPSDHPLWSLPNVLITPHTANTPEMAGPVLSRRVTENVRRFAAGEPLIGVIDVAAGY